MNNSSKKYILFFLATLFAGLFISSTTVFSAGSCSYCGQYFIFSDSNPYMECQSKMFECWDAEVGTIESCMCKVESDLNKKYTAEYLASKELVYWIGLLTQASGVSILGRPGLTPPGLSFLDPERRRYLLGEDARFHERVKAVFGGAEKPWGISKSSLLSEVGDERIPERQRIVGAYLGMLPGGRIKTVADLFGSGYKYWQAIKPEK